MFARVNFYNAALNFYLVFLTSLLKDHEASVSLNQIMNYEYYGAL